MDQKFIIKYSLDCLLNNKKNISKESTYWLEPGWLMAPVQVSWIHFKQHCVSYFASFYTIGIIKACLFKMYYWTPTVRSQCIANRHAKVKQLFCVKENYSIHFLHVNFFFFNSQGTFWKEAWNHRKTSCNINHLTFKIKGQFWMIYANCNNKHI